MTAVETLADLVFVVRDRSAGRPCLLSIDRGGRREALSTSDFLSGVHSLALALEARGLEKGDRVAIFSENRPEWHVTDFACQLLGAVTVPLYPSLSAEQVGYILRNSGCSWIFYSGSDKLDILERLRTSLTRTPVTVAFDEEARAPEGIGFVALQAEGAPATTTTRLDKLRGRVEPDDLSSLIYTSGTTGEPKGVMLTHHNFVSNLLAADQIFDLRPDDQALSFLPLSHVFERTVDHLFFYHGVAIHYSPSVERVAQLLPTVRPTVLCSVPRVYERAYVKVTQRVEKESATRQKIFHWAFGVGRRHARRRAERFVGPWLALQRAVADRLVFRKIRERFGGRLRLAIAGGAPLALEVAQFFEAAGFELYEGYGMTEAAPVISCNHPGHQRLGSVGPPLPGVEVRIADDGEILVRSEGVMKGYWDHPEATAEAIDVDGWLHTGDVGKLDEDGFLYITDRKKDLLVTSGGKNVAPQPIERLLVSHWAISQAIVAGDNYPYLSALVVPDFEQLPEDLVGLSRAELGSSRELRRILQEAIDDVNRRLSDHERIRKWASLEDEWSLESGELTPTLKVRRRVVLEKYRELVDGLYLKTQKTGSIPVQKSATGT